MAAVRQRTGKGKHEFALKILNVNLLVSRHKHGKGAVHVSSLSAGFLLGDFKNFGRNKAEKPANRLTEVRQDSYTSGKLPAASLESENYTEKFSHHKLREHSRSRTNLIKERTFSGYRNYTQIWRTLFNSVHGQQDPCFRCLYRGCGQFVFVRGYSSSETGSEPLYRTKTGYYDILGVSPSATKAQIKTAYYKRSFMFHPDRNSGSDEAAARFSEISEAYTVLGNTALRVKYDRGLLNPSDLTAPVRPGDSTWSSAKPTKSGRSVTNTDAFDFDKFYKNHYREQLQRERNVRARREKMLQRDQQTRDRRDSMMVFGGGFMLLFVSVVLLKFNQG